MPAKLVMLRYFGGLTIRETAESLGISPRTADSYWTYARAWLLAVLSFHDSCRVLSQILTSLKRPITRTTRERLPRKPDRLDCLLLAEVFVAGSVRSCRVRPVCDETLFGQSVDSGNQPDVSLGY